MPLAAKLALVISAVVLVFMAGFGLFLGGFLEETVRQQVLRAALEAAQTAAQADFDAWATTFGTEDQGLTAAEIQAKVDAMSPFEYRQYDGDEQRRAQRDWNEGRLERLVEQSERIVAADVVAPVGPGGEAKVVRASYEGALAFSRFAGRSDVVEGQARATEGRLTIGARNLAVIRGTAPLLDAGGRVEGELSVYIDSQAVDQAAASFKLKVMWAAALFVLLGAGISFALGSRVAAPLKKLQDDIRIVAGGDLGHHTRVHSSDEVGELARTFDQMTRSLAEARELERAAAASARQVSVAAEVAQSLVPDTLPEIPGYDRAGLQRVQGDIPGEVFDVIPMPGGRFGLAVADASGSGVSAALVMAMARSFLRVVGERESDPGAVLRSVNAHLAEDLVKGLYVAVLLVVVEPESGRLAIASAGAAPVIHYHAANGSVSLIHSEGIALGFDAGPVFDRTLNVVERTIEPGDRLVLHTPGVSAVANPDGEPLGEKRLGAVVKREAGTIAESFVGRLDATLRKYHGGDEDLGQDVTLLTLGRLG